MRIRFSVDGCLTCGEVTNANGILAGSFS